MLFGSMLTLGVLYRLEMLDDNRRTMITGSTLFTETVDKYTTSSEAVESSATCCVDTANELQTKHSNSYTTAFLLEHMKYFYISV